MSDVLLATAGLLVVGAVLMALFLPARTPHAEYAPTTNDAQPATA
jgi:hypothetical protein